MKSKLLATVGLMGVFSIGNAYAQNYNYVGNYSYDYGYNQSQAQQRASYAPAGQAPARRMPREDFNKFSIGADYVMGFVSLDDKTSQIESPLYGGDTYTASMKDFSDNAKIISGNIGWRPWRYLGFEAFYQQSLSEKNIGYQEHYNARDYFAQAEYEMEYKAYGLDAIAYIPLTSKIEFLASLGLANYDIDGTVSLNAYDLSTANNVATNKVSYSDSKLSYRAGLGAQVMLSEHLAFRIMYRYVSIGGDYFDDLSELSLGVRYTF